MTRPAPPYPLDEDAMTAAVELVGRAGAAQLQVGYLHEDKPAHEADWWAHAQYKGARITVEHHVGPVEALEALAIRILTGARCTHCLGLVALSDDGAIAYPGSRMADGTVWTEEEIRAARLCRWTRVGKHWRRGCETTNRSKAAAAKRGKGRKRGHR